MDGCEDNSSPTSTHEPKQSSSDFQTLIQKYCNSKTTIIKDLGHISNSTTTS